LTKFKKSYTAEKLGGFPVFPVCVTSQAASKEGGCLHSFESILTMVLFNRQVIHQKLVLNITSNQPIFEWGI
jgi:hypothetical protein